MTQMMGPNGAKSSHRRGEGPGAGKLAALARWSLEKKARVEKMAVRAACPGRGAVRRLGRVRLEACRGRRGGAAAGGDRLCDDPQPRRLARGDRPRGARCPRTARGDRGRRGAQRRALGQAGSAAASRAGSMWRSTINTAANISSAIAAIVPK